jgi:hypothetical protein
MLGDNAFDLVFNGLRAQGSTSAPTSTGVTTFGSDDFENVLIDARFVGVGRHHVGFDAARHKILTSGDLAPGRLAFEMRGDLTLSLDETLRFDGIKTDAIGARNRQFDGDVQALEFQKEIAELLATEGLPPHDGRPEDPPRRGLRRRPGHGRADEVRPCRDPAAVRRAAPGHLAHRPARRTRLQRDRRARRAGADDGRRRGVHERGSERDPRRPGERPRSRGRPLEGRRPDRSRPRRRAPADDGRLLYRPNHGFSGVDTFEYWATDGNGNFSKAVVTIDVSDGLL